MMELSEHQYDNCRALDLSCNVPSHLNPLCLGRNITVNQHCDEKHDSVICCLAWLCMTWIF